MGVFIVSVVVLFPSIFMLFKMNQMLIEHPELWKNKEEIQDKIIRLET